MRKLTEILSTAALILLLVSPCLYFGDVITESTNKLLMLIATILWFGSALAWMGRKSAE